MKSIRKSDCFLCMILPVIFTLAYGFFAVAILKPQTIITWAALCVPMLILIIMSVLAIRKGRGLLKEYNSRDEKEEDNSVIGEACMILKCTRHGNEIKVPFVVMYTPKESESIIMSIKHGQQLEFTGCDCKLNTGGYLTVIKFFKGELEKEAAKI